MISIDNLVLTFWKKKKKKSLSFTNFVKFCYRNSLLFDFRWKIGCLACSIPNCIFISRNCDGFNPHRRGDNETIFPNSMRTPVHIKSSHNSWVVSGVHFSVHRSVSTPKPEFNCRTFACWGCDGYNLFHNGLGPLRKPTKATNSFLWTSFNAIVFCFRLFSLECAWNCSLRFQRAQFGYGDSGMFLSVSEDTQNPWLY